MWFTEPLRYFNVSSLLLQKLSLAMDFSNWMGQLSNELRDRPIIYLAIPGSHDSLSYTIKSNSPVAPDSSTFIKLLNRVCGFILRPVIYKWCVTQTCTVTEQLEHGIRYFDLRISTKEDKNFYFVHGLYGDDITDALTTIRSFVITNEDEIVILDFQHFYNLSNGDHHRLIWKLKSIFGSQLCLTPQETGKVTLDWMKENGYKVIIIYRNKACHGQTCLWPPEKWPTPWPDTMSNKELLDFLRGSLHKRPSNAGFVSQCVLTPSKYTVLGHLWSGLHSICAIPAASVSIPWLQKQPPGLLNVAIADFIQDNDSLFSQTVISLNKLKM